MIEELVVPSHLRFRTADDHPIPTLQRLEQDRERRWQAGYSNGVQLKLNWRASVIRHTLNILPGETILEFGAGTGLLSEQLDGVLEGANPITGIVFSRDLLQRAQNRTIESAVFVSGDNLDELPSGKFDYVVGAGMLWHSSLLKCFRRIHALLKPGGKMLFFEPNVAYPAHLFNEMRSRKHQLLNKQTILAACSQADFVEVDLVPHDIVSTQLGLQHMKRLQAKAIPLEHSPWFRSACASVRLFAQKPGSRSKSVPNLATLPVLANAISVVIPARNEAPNIPGLIERILSLYGPYIHEIVIVNDGSTDNTEELLNWLAATDRRIRPVHRSKPNGVGLSLRAGYQAATGRYILSMDCDFVHLLPQFRGLFQAIADGHDGAIGSRFSHHSILVNYPFMKLVFNRLCHLLIKLFLFRTARDITNNLKLYRSEILKNLEIRSPHFSVNLETGLKPLLAGHDIIEVPISWVNRTPEMGTSSFSIRRVGLAYATTLLGFWRSAGLTQGRGAIQTALRRAWNRLNTRSPANEYGPSRH